MARPYSIKDAIHHASALSTCLERVSGKDYMAIFPCQPDTPLIVNVALNNDNWTPIAVGLTGVLDWRLSEAAGEDFYFAFEAAPTTYASAWGWVGGNQAITAIYAKRTVAVVRNMQLLYWV
jgi:hypothetical protein